MNAAKILIVVAVLAAGYFLFFATKLPAEIEFQGHSLGPRERVENNSAKEFDIYSYSDRSRHHMMLFVMAKSEGPTSQELLEFYVNIFTAQGYAFKKKDGRHLGNKGDEYIYMTRAPGIDSAIAYIEKSPNSPKSFRGAADIFLDLENYSFD